jgi:hypothetical protein
MVERSVWRWSVKRENEREISVVVIDAREEVPMMGRH